MHERIRWLGVQREVAPLYAMADAFVLPTSYETFSLATFEAAASGLPLLATPVNGICELLEPGVNGFFVDRRPRASRRSSGSSPATGSRMHEMGRAARRASLRFSWENTVERHHELYRRLAGGRRGARPPSLPSAVGGPLARPARVRAPHRYLRIFEVRPDTL